MSRRVVLTPSPRSAFAPLPGQTIVVPNNHVARQLKVPGLNLDDMASSVLMSRGLRPASGMALLRALTSAISEDSGWPDFDCDGSARAIVHSVNLLYRAGADLDGIALSGESRLARLGRVAAVAKTRLESNGLVPPAAALGRAIQSNPFPYPLCIYGYAQLSAMEAEFIDRITDDGSTLILPFRADAALFLANHRVAQDLTARGWNIEHFHAETQEAHIGEGILSAFLDQDAVPPGLQAHSFPNAEAEIRGVLSTVKAALADGAYSAREAVVVLRNEKLYGPLLQEIAWEYQLPIETSYSVALRETRLGSWLLLLLDAAEEGTLPFEATSWLLHHPYSRRLINDEFNTAGWPEARRIHARDEEWSASGAEIDHITWPETASRTYWTDLVVNTLNALNVHFWIRERPQDVAARASVLAALPDLANPGDEVIHRELFIAQMRDLLTLTEIPASDASGGISVHTPLALYGTSYPHVYILGMVDEILPASIRDDPYLDFAGRKELAESGLAALESAAEAARREQLSFTMLLLTPEKSLNLSFPRQIEGGAATPSPYLKRLKLADHPIEPAGRPFRFDLCDGTNTPAPLIAASALDALSYDLMVEDVQTDLTLFARRTYNVSRKREDGVHNEFSGKIGESFDFSRHLYSASEITYFGQCAYRWHAMRLLGLREPDEAEDDLAGRTKGTLFHGALARAAEGTSNAPDLRIALLDRLERALDEAIAEQPSVTRIPGWTARRSELLRVLRRAVADERFLLPNAAIVDTESDFVQSWMGLRIRGRLDRLDEIDGKFYVVDYKSSGNPQCVKDENGELEIDFQLPIYILLGRPAAQTPISGGYYFALNDGRMIDPIDVPGIRSSASLDEKSLEMLASAVKGAAAAGDYPVNPDNEQKACAYCEFDALCRRGPHLTRMVAPSE